MQTDLIVEIRRRMPRFSEGQARIAKFVLEFPEKAQDISLAELCRRCNTSEPVVFAFCALVGCEGYKAFKTRLAGYLGARGAREQADAAVSEKELTLDARPRQVLAAVAALYKQSVDETISSIDPDAFEEAVDAVAAAARVVLFGVGISGNAGFLLQQNYLRTGIPATWANDPNLFFTHLVPLKKTDVCIALSQTGSQRDTLDGIRFARKRGVKVIAITSDSQSPIATEASIVLLTGPAPVRTHTHLSVGARLALPVILVADTLAVCVGMKDNEGFQERARATAEAMKPRNL